MNTVDARQVKFGWDTIHTAIDTLAYMLAPLQLRGIIGVARGGLIPAAMLSHKLNVPQRTLHARSYDDKTNKRGHTVELQIDPAVRALALSNPPRWAIVDDILDSGHTFDAIKCNLGTASPYVCIVTKRMFLPVSFFAQVPHDVWVKFPWE